MTNLFYFQCQLAYRRFDVHHVVKERVVFTFRDWMSKVERARSRTSDNQEGWKEGSEDHVANKTSWADGADPRAPSPAGMGQYKSAAQQELQVQRSLRNFYTSWPACLYLFILFPGW